MITRTSPAFTSWPSLTRRCLISPSTEVPTLTCVLTRTSPHAQTALRMSPRASRCHAEADGERKEIRELGAADVAKRPDGNEYDMHRDHDEIRNGRRSESETVGRFAFAIGMREPVKKKSREERQHRDCHDRSDRREDG